MHYSTRSNRLSLIQSLDNLELIRITRPFLVMNKASTNEHNLNMLQNLLEEFEDFFLKDLKEDLRNLFSIS